MNDMIELMGFVSTAPIVLCKNEEVAMHVRRGLHNNTSKMPPVIVIGDVVWPDILENAVVITPLRVMGTREESDFSLPGLPDDVRNAMLAATHLATLNKPVSVRNLATELGVSRRQAIKAQDRLIEFKLAIRDDEREPLRLLWGRWVPDKAAAKAAGITIKEY